MAPWGRLHTQDEPSLTSADEGPRMQATKLETESYSDSCTRVTSDSVSLLIRGGLA